MHVRVLHAKSQMLFRPPARVWAHGGLSERALEPGVVKLIAGLLKHNRTLHELDLTASDVEKVGALALCSALEANSSLSVLRLAYNPLIDHEAKAALQGFASKTLSITLA